jgi:hypothetical protein
VGQELVLFAETAKLTAPEGVLLDVVDAGLDLVPVAGAG